jgi:hypothetical protein
MQSAGGWPPFHTTRLNAVEFPGTAPFGFEQCGFRRSTDRLRPFLESQNQQGCPIQCPAGQQKRRQRLVATEGVLLNMLDVANILNS